MSKISKRKEKSKRGDLRSYATEVPSLNFCSLVYSLIGFSIPTTCLSRAAEAASTRDSAQNGYQDTRSDERDKNTDDDVR